MSLARWAHLAAWDTQWSAKTVVFEISLVVASSLDPPFYTWVTLGHNILWSFKEDSAFFTCESFLKSVTWNWIEQNWAKNIQSYTHDRLQNTTKTGWQSWTIKLTLPERTDLRHVLTSAHIRAKAEVLASNCWALARTTPMAWRHVTTVSSLKDWSSIPRSADAWNGRHHVMLQDPQTSKPGGFCWPNFGWIKSPNLCLSLSSWGQTLTQCW